MWREWDHLCSLCSAILPPSLSLLHNALMELAIPLLFQPLESEDYRLHHCAQHPVELLTGFICTSQI